jgi:hypothetical protein
MVTSRIQRVLLVALVSSTLFSTLFLVACVDDNQAIEDTITEFIVAFDDQQFSRCLELYSSRLRFSEGDTNLLQRLHDERAWDFNVSLKSIGEPQISGVNAVVWIDYQTGLLQTVNTKQIYLTKENGEWKIDNIWE